MPKLGFHSGAILLGLAAAAWADSTTVFNEAMYHPPQTNEAAFEWIELRNQMAVDMDLSGWTLEGGIDYRFPEGTVIQGRGYLVVAGSPDDLRASGVTNLLGPFTGRLSNSGEKIELRNNNRRLMDTLDYRTEGDWAVAPDGAGPSLAKRDEDGATLDSANWQPSLLIGGTPGSPNTPVVSVSQAYAVRLDSGWRYATPDSGPDSSWRERAFDDSDWASGAGLFCAGINWSPTDTQPIATLFSSGLDSSRTALAAGKSDPHFTLTASAYSTPPPPAISATVMANHPNWLANDASSRWVGAVSSGSASVPAGAYQFRTTFDLTGMDTNTASLSLRFAVDNRLTNVFLNGVARGLNCAAFNAFSVTNTLSSGFVQSTNTLDFCTVNDGTAANPGGFRVEAVGTAGKWLPTNTVLSASPTTRYFRTAFVVSGDPSTATLALRAIVDDGVVFHLNGSEVLRLNLPAGPLSHATAASTNVAQAAVLGPYALPTASLVAGTNVLAAEVHQAASGSNDLLFGAELWLSLTNGLLPAMPTLAFNEFPCVTNQVFWAELINTGSQNVSLSNYVLKRFGTSDLEYVLPPETLEPGGRTVLDRSDLGFGADPGDRLVLYTPNKAAVIDSALAKSYPRARWPEGSGPWLHPVEATPGATNRVVLRDDLVINEIMYHPRDPQGSATHSPEQWIELFNRGTGTVDLTGWRLEIDGKTALSFPVGRTLAGSGYLVVALDAAFLQSLYPTLDIVGNLGSRLPGGNGKIDLFDAADNPADTVSYADGSPWPTYADGLSASLELRDPRADNSRAEAWAASDDRAKASWQTYTYRGTATVETASSPTLWKEFVLGLLDEGEVLLDDVSVVQQPAGAARQLLQNCTFETGTNTWRLIGNHRHGEVVIDPDNAANHALLLVADGYTEHMHNHAETTLASGAAVTNGLDYEISFRAKWVAGCNRLLTRLYFNRLPRLTEIGVPDRIGTPGARNSTYAANSGPTFRDVSHLPVVPVAAQAVTVSAAASDPDGVATGTLYYAVNSGTWQTAQISPQAAPGGGVTLSAVVPGQAAGSVVQFYVESTDGLGAKATWPADGTNSRALFEVSSGAAVLPRLHTVRVILTTADTAYLHSSVNVMSNERLGCTLITDEKTVAYDAGMHLQGSERGRNDSSRVGFTVRLPSDRPYRGVLDGITVDRSGGYTAGKGGDQDEILIKHAINKAGRLPGMYDDLCQVFAPRASDDGLGLLLLAKYGSEFLDSQYKDGSDGELFKLELVYYPTANSVPGDVQSPKLPSPDVVLNTDIKDLGSDQESYRWTFLKENHTARNNYAPMVELAKAFSLTGAALDAKTRQLMDVDEWMRGLAFLNLLGGSDMYSIGNSHNAIFYFRPEDGRGLLFPWDMDYSFTQATNTAFPGTGSANTTKLISLPSNLHAFYGHLYDLSSVTGDSAYLGRWATHYAGLVGQDWSGAVTYLKDRANYVRSKLPLSTPFAITNNLGNGFSVTNSPVTLGGTGPITVKSITVNGVEHPVTWTSATNWTVTVSLPACSNALSLQAYDLRGTLLTNAADAITVANVGTPAPLPVVINEWMADNVGPAGYPDPADQKFQDWLELYNPNDAPVNLSGFTLTDNLDLPAKWALPTNTVIAPRAFLLVFADDESAQNGTDTNGSLHAAFKLSNGGESLGLFSPSGVRQHALSFGQQSQNVSQGLYPDGSTNSVCAMTNWTPGASNRLGAPLAPDVASMAIGPTALISIGLPTAPGHAYVVQYTSDLRAPAWLTLQTNRAQTGVWTFTDNTAAGVTQRFYRALLLQ